jgi:hypothetical protein
MNAQQLLEIYDPEQDTPRTIPGLASKGCAGPTPNMQAPIASAIHWSDFAADGRLWVLDQDVLQAWDLKAGRPTSKADGRPTIPIVMGPNRTWLAVGADEKYLEVLDTATGECRGRFGGEGWWQALATSLDGGRLAGVRYPGDGLGPGPNAYDFPFEVHDWDLTTGQLSAIVAVVRKLNAVDSVHWIDADHLLLNEALLDMKLKMHVASARVKSPPGSQAAGDLKEAGWTSDGRQWANVGLGRLVPVKYPLEAVAGEPAFRPGEPVKVEARCGSAALDERVRAVMGGALRHEGFRVGEGGWTLRVSAGASDTKLMMGSVPIPEVRGTVELVAPDGRVTASSVHKRRFPRGLGSKYYKGADQDPMLRLNGVTVGRYDFRGRSPAAAMRAEAWAHSSAACPIRPGRGRRGLPPASTCPCRRRSRLIRSRRPTGSPCGLAYRDPSGRVVGWRSSRQTSHSI